MMDKDDERMMYAMGALSGLVMRGESWNGWSRHNAKPAP